jgi:hypothetical protein
MRELEKKIKMKITVTIGYKTKQEKNEWFQKDCKMVNAEKYAA